MNDELMVYSCLTNDYWRVVIIKCYRFLSKNCINLNLCTLTVITLFC